MGTFLKIAAIAVALIVFVGTLVFLYSKSGGKPDRFELENPFFTDIMKKVVATGAIVPRKEIDIKPQVSGVVDQIHVDSGDIVKKGDLIAKIRIIPDTVSLNNAESQLNRAGIKLRDAEKSWKRHKKMYKEGVIAGTTLQEYELAYRIAREEMEAAENHLQLIREGIAKKPGKTTNTLIRSTIGGMVLDVPVEEGDFVIETNTFNDGTTIATVADMNEMVFEGRVEESEVGKLKTGMELVLTVGAVVDEKYHAELEYIAPRGIKDQGSVQFEIRAKVRLTGTHFIRAGYSANADIILEKKANVLAVNESVLIFEDGKTYVEIETDPDSYEKRLIQTGLSDGLKIEVVSGLTEKDKIKTKRAPRI